MDWGTFLWDFVNLRIRWGEIPGFSSEVSVDVSDRLGALRKVVGTDGFPNRVFEESCPGSLGAGLRLPEVFGRECYLGILGRGLGTSSEILMDWGTFPRTRLVIAMGP